MPFKQIASVREHLIDVTATAVAERGLLREKRQAHQFNDLRPTDVAAPKPELPEKSERSAEA